MEVITEGIRWEGRLKYSIFDEEQARKKGFLDDEESFYYAIKHGLLPIKRTSKSKNTVTNYARQQIANILTGAALSINPPNKMQLGTGSGTPTASDADLWSPSSGTLKQCQSIQPYLTYYAQFITTWLTTDNAIGTWTEIGLKDGNSNLWAHSSISSNITINTGEALTAQWQIQILSN